MRVICVEDVTLTPSLTSLKALDYTFSDDAKVISTRVIDYYGRKLLEISVEENIEKADEAGPHSPGSPPEKYKDWIARTTDHY